MNYGRRAFLSIAAGGGIAVALPRIAGAQHYPARPVRMIVPYAAGGPTDLCARLIGQQLSEQLGGQFYVENIGGAGGNLGTGQAAKAAPDGHTVLIAVNNHVINPVLYGHVPYDPYRDFDPVTLMVTFASALFVHPSLPVDDVKAFTAFAKANALRLSFASPGFGTPSHLLGEQFRITQGLDMVHVPYNGSGPATAAVVANHTPIGFAALSAAAPFAEQNKLRVLAVMSRQRSQAMPNIPTIEEAGFPDLDGDGWIGALVPAGTAKEITETLYRQITAIIGRPDVNDRLMKLGFEPIATTPQAFALQMRVEADKWAKVIRAAELKAQ